jgi:hypothetical protein
LVLQVLYVILLTAGCLATIIPLGLIVVHWAAEKPPLIDRDGWLMVAVGTTILAALSLVDGSPPWWTVALVAVAGGAAVASARTPRRVTADGVPQPDER